MNTELLTQLFIPNIGDQNDIPQYIHLFRTLQKAIVEGRLRSGSKLPASRPLAVSLKLSRNTVKAAYELLQAEGYIETKKGAGSYVTSTDFTPISLEEKTPLEVNNGTAISYSKLMHRLEWQKHNQSIPTAGLLTPAIPAMAEFPWMQWQKSIHFAGRTMKHQSMSSSLGCEYLREQISSYLKIVRGVSCSRNNILIFSGSQQAIYLALQVLIDPGDHVLVENPCYYGINGALNALDAIQIPIDVDQHGFKLNVADQQKSKVTVITPSRNYPLGHTLSLHRRIALLEWAKLNNSWIIEDDYDSEFRFDGPPLTSLQGLTAQSRVIYAGTFSRILHPSIRIGYLVLPNDLVEPFATAKKLMHGNIPVLPQLALANFMANGHFSSHVRKMRKLYLLRRTTLQLLISRHLSYCLTLVDSDGGMHCVYLLAEGYDDREVCDSANLQGIGIAPLSSYYHGEYSKQGLVIGFAGYNEVELTQGVLVLTKVLIALK